MTELAIIGGTGLTSLKGLEITRRVVVNTPYDEPSAPITYGVFCGHEVIFLPRHGLGHTIPPHRVNYRANVWALKELDVERVIAVASVGSINEQMPPMSIVFPDQIIDYTWSRKHTFYEDGSSRVTHIDFTRPYCEDLRRLLIEGAGKSGIPHADQGTYGATQGPRLETAAEIKRMKDDGCDVVGMTGMPEASLARELGLCYASCAVVANWAAGLGGSEEIDMATLEKQLMKGMEQVRMLLGQVIPLL